MNIRGEYLRKTPVIHHLYPDDIVYGLVQLGSDRLGDGFRVSVEKVFVCTGVAGQVPHYEPGRGQYGCLGPNNKLLHTIRVLDKGSPAAINTRFQGADFEARFVDHNPAATTLAKSPLMDGFSFSAKPLFRVDPGHHWFLHTIYTIQSAKSHRGRREVLPHLSHAVSSVSALADEERRQRPPGRHVTGTHRRQHHRRHDVHRKGPPDQTPGSPGTLMGIAGDHREVAPLETSVMFSTNQNAAAATRMRTLPAEAVRSSTSHESDVMPAQRDGSMRVTRGGSGVTRPKPRPGVGRHRRDADPGKDGAAHTGTGTNMVVIALDYSNTAHSSRLYMEERAGEEKKSQPQVALVAGLSTAFVILVATVLVAITVARYNCLHEEDTCDSDSSCHEEAAYNLPPPPPPPGAQSPNQLCGKVTQV